ncbi:MULTISPECIES: SRPBCC family protein [unclassified Pseudofrankia]|uniref:aromatic ring-hydroxylating oxygenase subunit alpha n=1 Tax=unclassified Pseudofrankia TaxID=2994372 RepID=UPI0008D90B1E|nr:MULTISPECIES: SRPBCC family protein [unclassified Pseudofrankia]MDT3446935.1 SRPBCC family protein [Pseudofrankia sp. BMG5.37]OHV53900.1 (2Fe-2S)-binding protein [Pseudofrankia sp. BMG5.36]
MDHTTLVDLTRRVLKLAADRTADLAPGVAEQNASAYFDPDRLAADRELFRRTPQIAGYAGELAEPGAFVTKTVMGTPLVLTRQEDGSVAAFHNVCAHRQAPVASGCGVARRFACPYHAWTYDTVGRLRHMPMPEGFPDQPTRLTRLPATEHAGFLWVALDPDAELDIEAHLAGLSDELASWGVGAWTPMGERVLNADIDWKLAVDTFAENYHFATVHRETFASVALSGVAAFDTYGPHSRLVFPMRTITELIDRPEQEWNPLSHAVVIYHLHPGVVISTTVNNGELFRIYPSSEPGRSVTFHQNATPVDVSDEAQRLAFEEIFEYAHATVRDEDYTLAEQVQRNLASGTQPVLRFGRNEPCLQHRHVSWEYAIREAVTPR